MATVGTYPKATVLDLRLSFKRFVSHRGTCNAGGWMNGNDSNFPNNQWLLELRTASGSGGSLISGAHIGLGTDFSGRRATGTHNSRSHSTDGAWPIRTVTRNVGIIITSHYYAHPNITITIPSSYTGPVYLRTRIRFNDGNGDPHWEDISFKFNEAKVGVHPLVLPLDSNGEPATTDASAGRLRPTGGTLQRARLLLRAAAHSGAYAAADANAARSAFSSATLKIASDAAGATAISGATITQSDGTSAIAACTEAAAGHTCTVTSANWPQGTGMSPLTEPLNVYFQVPASHTGNAYLVLTAARTNYASRNFALQYATTQVSIYPLAAPQTSGGTITTGNLVTSSRTWAVVGGAQRAAIFLRSADHGNEYDSTDTNVARSAFTEAQIEIAADPGGARPIAGAKIGSSSALTSAITACTETTVGNTCTITSASYPQGSGMSPVTSQLDIYFSVPDRHEGDAYVVVRAFGAGAAPRTFALKYDPVARTAAHPLPVPISGGNPVDWDVTLAQRDFAASAGRQQVRLFLRDAAATRYVASDTNVARGDFWSATIKVTSDAAGNTPLSGALISDSTGSALGACTEAAAGHTCTIVRTNFPEGGSPAKTTHQDIWFSVPSGHTAPVWLSVVTAQSARRNSYFELKYDPPPTASGAVALVNGGTAACPRVDGHVLLDAGEYSPGAATNITIKPRQSHFGSGSCTTSTALGGTSIHVTRNQSNFWKMSLNHAPGDGTPIAGATITLPSGFSTARSGGRNPRGDSGDGNWPNSQATAITSWLHNAAISFTVPSTHSGPIYLYVRVNGRDRNTNQFLGVARATFKFQPPLQVHPLVVPGGTADGTDVSAGARDFAGGGNSQQAQVFLRSAAHSGTYTAADANAERSAFDTALITVASDAAGQNLITDAVISSDSAGATAITACTEATAGNTCTIASGSWPQAASGTPLRTLAQDLHFSVPAGRFGDIYLVVKVSKAGSSSRTFALQYGNPLVAAAPLAVPVDLASGTPNESGDLSGNTRSWAAAEAQRRAKLYLRAQAHADTFTAADANAAPAAFDTVTIRLASGAAGAAEVSGAKLVADAAGVRISACSEQAAGPTCTIASADWPASAGLTTELDLRFTVPETHGGDVYLVVTAAKSGELPRRFALKYDPAYAVAFPLAVPLSSGGAEETGDLKTPMRSFEPGGETQRARIFLRSLWPDDEYISSAANAASSAFTDVTIRIATTSAGGTAAANAKISSDDAGANVISACTETSVGATCTVTSANWPATSGTTDALDIYWSVPDARTDDAYLVVTVTATGKSSRTFWLKYEPGLPVFPIAVPSGTADGTDLSAGSREFAENGASQEATVYLRAASHSDTYTAADANAAENLFERASLRIATDAEGTTPAAGAKISSDAAGTAKISHCAEASPGHTCTIANWPATGGTADSLPLHFSVPHDLGADVHLVVAAKKAGEPNRVFALQYDDPLVQAFPLAVPLSSGGAEETGDLKTPERSFAAGNETQRARIYLRDAHPGDEYDSSDANAASSDFTSVTIRIATTSGGGTAATGAKISSDAAGANVISACTETSVGATCTVTSANWPATSGTTDSLDIYWSVPDARTDDAYVVVTVDGASGKTSRAFWLKYEAGLPVFPLAVPLDGSGTEETGDLSARTGNYLHGAQRQRARVFLRDAAHGSEYLGAQTNVSSTGQLFERVVIKLTEDAAGNTLLTGGLITDQSGAALSACNEAAAGNTCTIPAASWPASAGTTGAFDLWFSAPDDIKKAVHLHVTVEKTGEPPRAFALPYADPYVAAWPLIVPKPGGTYETGTLSTATRRWLPEQGLNLIGFFFRDRERTAFDGNHASPATGAFDGHVHMITDADGNRLSGAAFTDNAGTSYICGNRCTASWLQGDLRFKIPDSHTGAVYIHLTATKPGKLSRSTSLKWDPPLTVSGHPGALPFDDDGTVGVPPAGEFSATGGTDKARISIRTAAGSSTGAATTAFQSVKLTLASDAAGTALTGAVLASDAAGTTVLTGCSEGSTAGNVCTIPVANWPATGGAAGDLDLYFTVPLTRAAAVYLHVRVEKAGERDRTFALKYDAPVGARSDNAGPALDPRLSDGTAERDDDGDGDRADNEHYYGLAAERQRVAVRIYRSAATSGWDETAELASFASLGSTAALALSASYPAGQTTTSLNASQIVFTKPDGTALGCTEPSYAGGTCTLSRATLKTLMGIASAVDARRSLQFEFAFAIQTAFTDTADVTLNADLTRHSGATGSASATAVYKRGATAASNAQPFAMQLQAGGAAETGNVVTRDPQRRYSPGGAATPVNLRVYESATEIQTYTSSTSLVSYSTIEQVTIEIRDRPSPSNRITGAQITVPKHDGTSACTEAAATNVCTITAANYLLTGPPRAGNHYRAFPVNFSFTVPSAYQNSDFGNADLIISVVRAGSGMASARTQTFTLPFDGGTRAEPFAMVADATGNAPAMDQQWAQAGARTPIWAHVYNASKTAHEAVSSSNTAQYWEFDQASGTTAVKIELLDGASGTAAPSGGLITAADSAAKFAPCTESEPSNVCTITLAALKAYDSEASPDDNDAVDPLKFAVSIPQGSTNLVRLKLTVNRSDSMTKVREFSIYAPWAYPLLAPVGADGRPRAGSLSATVWEYEPRGRPTPLALELYNARQQQYTPPTAALRPSFADFETVTIRVQDAAGDLIAGAELTARNGTPLRGLCPVAASCEITRAEWQARQRGARAPGGLEFAASVPAEYSAAAVIRIELAHTARTAPTAAQPVNEQSEGTGPVQRIALEDSSGVRTAVYELRMVSPAKRAFALPLIADADAATGLRVCTQAESGSGAAALTACTAPSVQRGTPIGFAATLMRGLEAHPANPPTANGDELVQYNEITTLTISAAAGEIIHQALCPRATSAHPVYQPTAQTDTSTCTISSAALQAFQGAAEANEPIRPLALAYVPSATSGATGTVRLSYAIAGASPPEMIEQTLAFAHLAGPGRRAAGVYLDWSDPGSAYTAAAPAALFAIGRADSRATAAPAPRSALPGRVKSATFAELAEAKAVELTISQGTIAYNGQACAASSAGCTLSLSRAELLAGAGTATASDPIGNLRTEYALPLGVSGPTTITVRARFDGEEAAATGELAIAHPAVSSPVGSAYLPTDADGVIAAGATAEVAAGFTVAVDAVGPGWGCARPDPSFLELDVSGKLLDACAGGLSRLPGGDAPSAAAAWLIADSYLAITGPATWRVEGPGDGSKRLMLGGTWSRMRCGLASAQGASTAGERDIACWITDAEGNRPSIAIDPSAAEDVRITASLIPTRERRFHIFTGAGSQPADRYAETAAAFRLASGPLFRTAEIDVGEPAPVASVALARAAGASGPVPRGGTADLEVPHHRRRRRRGRRRRDRLDHAHRHPRLALRQPLPRRRPQLHDQRRHRHRLRHRGRRQPGLARRPADRLHPARRRGLGPHLARRHRHRRRPIALHRRARPDLRRRRLRPPRRRRPAPAPPPRHPRRRPRRDRARNLRRRLLRQRRRPALRRRPRARRRRQRRRPGLPDRAPLHHRRVQVQVPHHRDRRRPARLRPLPARSRRARPAQKADRALRRRRPRRCPRPRPRRPPAARPNPRHPSRRRRRRRQPRRRRHPNPRPRHRRRRPLPAPARHPAQRQHERAVRLPHHQGRRRHRHLRHRLPSHRHHLLRRPRRLPHLRQRRTADRRPQRPPPRPADPALRPDLPRRTPRRRRRPPRRPRHRQRPHRLGSAGHRDDGHRRRPLQRTPRRPVPAPLERPPLDPLRHRPPRQPRPRRQQLPPPPPRPPLHRAVGARRDDAPPVGNARAGPRPQRRTEPVRPPLRRGDAMRTWRGARLRDGRRGAMSSASSCM